MTKTTNKNSLVPVTKSREEGGTGSWGRCCLSSAAVTSYHRLSSWKQLRFILSDFCGSDIRVGSSSFSAQNFTGFSSDTGSCILTGVAPEDSASTFIRTVGRVQFLTTVGLRSHVFTISWRLPLAPRVLCLVSEPNPSQLSLLLYLGCFQELL